jgi:cytochrome c2
MMKAVTAVAMLLSASDTTALAQSVANGANVFHQCMICHSVGPGAQNKIGPELNGLDGRHSGTVANYSYSTANKNSGIVGRDNLQTIYRQSAGDDSRHQNAFRRTQRPAANQRSLGLSQAIQR